MILATRIVLLVVSTFFFLATMSAGTERRGYLDLTGAIAAAILLLLFFRIT